MYRQFKIHQIRKDRNEVTTECGILGYQFSLDMVLDFKDCIRQDVSRFCKGCLMALYQDGRLKDEQLLSVLGKNNQNE